MRNNGSYMSSKCVLELQMNKHLLIATFVLALAICASERLALTSTVQKTSDRRAASITGRVVNESGQPVPNAIVFVFGIGTQRPERRNMTSDESGTFRADDLSRGVYSISARARGFVFAPDSSEPAYYRPGDTVTLKVKKGGVITGTVTSSTGEPVVGIRVSAVPHRDAEGHSTLGLGAGTPAFTDDRGVYRLFGLSPGFYLVAAGAKLPGFPMATAFDDDAPTYYPSSTRDTGSEVAVHFGDEASGINIRYRGERGYAVSGYVVRTADGSREGAEVRLVRASSGAIEGLTNAQPRGKDYAFAFYGVSEGEYYIIGQRYSYQNDDGARSRPIPVKVKDRAVAGVEITLNPLSSVAGRLILDPVAANDKSGKCETTHTPSIEETLINARLDQKRDPKGEAGAIALLSLPTSALSAPNEKGEFLLQRLEPGQYRIEPRMLDESWYIRAITLPSAARGAAAIDAARNGFRAKAGARISGLTVTLAEGAASLRGRVISQKLSMPLPDRLRVHLIPAEPEASDEVLRFAEAAVQTDGTFTLSNLAPGRYWVVTRQASEEEAIERSPRPLYWQTGGRAGLRREGITSNLSIELKPCQHITDYKLRYPPSKEPPSKPGTQ
jgi:hypothetical protein